MAVVRSRHAQARITEIGLEAARALPGVAGVYTAPDLPEIKRSMPAASGGSYKGRAFTVPVLAHQRVRYVGEPVAIVLAVASALAELPGRAVSENGRLRQGAGGAPRSDRRRRGLVLAMLGKSSPIPIFPRDSRIQSHPIPM
jgi:hypothetical protein